MALAMVGEALISASVEILTKRIASREFRDFFSSRKLNISVLDELMKLLALNAVLNLLQRSDQCFLLALKISIRG